MNQNASPEKLFEDLRAFMKEKLALLADDPTTSLAGLDSNIQALCDAIMTLPVAESRKYAAELDKLQEQLSHLSAFLTAEKDAVRGQLENMSTQKKAHSAYKTADAMDGGVIVSGENKP